MEKRGKRKAKVQEDYQPTVAEARRIREIPNYTPGEDVSFRKGHCVFLKHADIEDENSGDDYYKMRVKSFHQKRGQPTVWLVGNWFYSAEEVEKLKLSQGDMALIPFIGPTELVETDHVSVVDAACIQARCFVHEFNDQDSIGFPLKPEHSWFTRLAIKNWDRNPNFVTKLSLHCICRMPYDPAKSAQRFCVDCKLWYHEGCLRKLDRGPEPPRTATETLLNVPYVRGWEGKTPGSTSDWLVVGTGERRLLVEEHMDGMESDGKTLEEQWSQWEGTLGEEYVPYARNTTFARYECPSCKKTI